MKNRVFRTTAITALLLSLTACSGYQGITARACIAVYPVDKPDQWAIGCSEGITGDREIVTVNHTGQPTAKLVTTGFDTSALESGGWRKIHDNVLIGSATQP